jgi:hypothetical protein
MNFIFPMLLLALAWWLMGWHAFSVTLGALLFVLAFAVFAAAR